MKHFVDFFLKGLLVVAPLSISVYCIVWIFVFVEKLAQQGISQIFSVDFKFPGLGILITVLIIVGIGAIMHTWIAQRLYEFLQRIIAKLPVLKTIYFAIEDFMGFFASNSKETGNKKVVLVKLGDDFQVVGIVTNEQPENVLDSSVQDKIAVYLPMSYQIGGYTIFIDRDKITETELSVEDGMKLSMTGWIKKAIES